MKRRTFVGAGLASAMGPFAAAARAPEHARIGVLVTGSGPHPIAEALPKELAARGYAKGAIDFDIRYAARSNERAAALAKELVGSKPDVLVAHFTPATKALKAATDTIPIVFAPAGDPVRTGLVASLAHPGGNLTGITNLGSVLGGRRLQILRDLIPGFKVMGVLASRDDPFSTPLVENFEEAAAMAPIEVRPIWYDRATDVDKLLAAIDQAQPQALYVQGLDGARQDAVLQGAARRRLPVMGQRAYVQKGVGLVCVNGSDAEIYRTAAVLVDRILKGARPADLPVEQPTAVEVTVSRKVAHDLGLTIPPIVLAEADEVVD